MKKFKFWLALIVVAVIAVVAYYWFAGGSGDKVTYRTEAISRGDVVVSISATGTLSADTTVQVGSQVSGTIAKLYADFNSVVKKGQLLAQLDPTFLQAAVDQQKANVDRAQASVDDASRTYKRSQELFDKSLASQADLDAATTALQTNTASLRQAQAALSGAETNLKFATILSPISGVVISRNVDVGQTVAASLSAPTLFTIANDLTKMQVQASIDEADVGSVKPGQKVSFHVDAYPDDEFLGTVKQIRLQPITTQNVVTYNVIIDVQNPQLKLMPGMTATVSIEVARKDDVLRVPLMALRITPPGVTLPSAQNGANGGGAFAADAGSSGAAQGDSSRAGGQQGERSFGGRRGMRGPGADSTAGGGGMRWRQMHADSTGGDIHTSTNFGRVWVLRDGKPEAVRVIHGIQDSRYAVVLRSDLKEGDEVIVGATGGEQNNNNEMQNPFMPRFGGGRGRH
jgi:HlyD family secretion protein